MQYDGGEADSQFTWAEEGDSAARGALHRSTSVGQQHDGYIFRYSVIVFCAGWNVHTPLLLLVLHYPSMMSAGL